MMFRGKVQSIGAGVHRHALDEIVLANRNHFSVWIEIVFGVEGTALTECVGTTVCSPSWLEASLDGEAVVRCGEVIVMRRYDASKLTHAIDAFARSCRAPTEKEMFEKLSRIGYSEFEDYNEPAALRQFLDEEHRDRRIPFQRISSTGHVES